MTTSIDWDGVALFSIQWVTGTRAAAYFGPISVSLWALDDHADDWEPAEENLLNLLRAKALELGANAVVGLEVTFDPFAYNAEANRHGLYLRAVGTAAKLEAI